MVEDAVPSVESNESHRNQSKNELVNVVGVRFKAATKIYFFAPNDLLDLEQGEYVIVETSRGREVGYVVQPHQEVRAEEVVGQLKSIVDRATAWDMLQMMSFRAREPEVLEKCRQKVIEYRLPMKLVRAEYNYDGSRLVFFFTSEKRVDFRELVRDLAKTFRTRIELRQIGVRDEAKLLGGVGCCGRPQCCSSWLNDFHPVSIRMAKQQDLPLSPMEISGVCGRLLCCLSYENDFYCEAKKNLPQKGDPVVTEHGPGKVIDVNVLKDSVTVALENEAIVEVLVKDLEEKIVKEEEPTQKPGRSRRRRRKKSGGAPKPS